MEGRIRVTMAKLCGLSLACLLALAAVARAEDVQSREKFKRANAHFSLGRFSQAAHEYEQLYEKHPDQPVLLYNIAQSWRLAGDNEKALFFYRRYVSLFPQAKNRAEVDGRITQLEAAVSAAKKAREMPPNEPTPAEPAPAPAVAPAATVAAAPPPPPKPMEKPLYKKWWLWTIVGGVVVAGVVVAVAVVATQHNTFTPSYPEFGPAATSHALQWKF
jgi:tetratricopeptide (TPR) repeat protein